MKKMLVAFMFGLLSITAFAEATFDEIQGLINSKNYAAAEAGLEVIIKNHPNSAKAFYAMAQAQAGLGNLEKAQYALNKAKSIDVCTARFDDETKQAFMELYDKVDADFQMPVQTELNIDQKQEN